MNDLTYVGSTCQTLAQRMTQHRTDMKNRQRQHLKLYQAMNEIGKDNFYIELVENYPCQVRDELHKKEGATIRECQSKLNSSISGRDAREYYHENKQSRLDYQKQYQQKNKNQIKERKHRYYKTHIEERAERDHQYYQENKERILLHKKEYREQNKDQIAEKKKQHYEKNKNKILEKQRQYYKKKTELRMDKHIINDSDSID